ncbi:unnamed protein product [Gongylonema pulchrum]|uniref:long-chain-fatty-acid--CoA ligase n=1 Tax=Gongylonema pulchrum TaxID=637853 RepID=A0A183DMG6_9BILA|nr:unnamed protein product [Gongylonema pulchrum]
MRCLKIRELNHLICKFLKVRNVAFEHSSYGQTECSAAGTISLPFDTQGGHVGGPAAWAQVKLMDVKELGYSAEENIGEVCFRGAALMNGYFNDPEQTSKSVDNEVINCEFKLHSIKKFGKRCSHLVFSIKNLWFENFFEERVL